MSQVNRAPSPCVGEVFGTLTFVREGARQKGRRTAICRCPCGDERPYLLGNLKRGLTKRCNICKLANTQGPPTTHGMSGKPEYQTYHRMLRRCYDKNDPKYGDYGGRGIQVCDRWKSSFENFFQDMGLKPAGTSIERRRNNEDYSPDNCEWATTKTQARNKRTTVFLTVRGETKKLAEWADETGQSLDKLRLRMQRGWPPERIVDTP